MITVVRVGKDPRDPNAGVEHADRAGCCLEFAAEYLMDQGGTLVHGSIWHPEHSERRIGHAWVNTLDGGVFEPTLGVWFPTVQAFHQWSNSIVDVTYDQEQAALLMLRSGHYGVWGLDTVKYSGVWGDMVHSLG